MKKIIALLLLLVSLTLCTVACASDLDREEKETKKETEAQTEKEETPVVDLVEEDVLEKYPELEELFDADDYEDLKNLDAETIEAILALKDDIVEGFGNLIEASEVEVDVDEKTGVITFNADILFDHDKYELKEEAKETLNNVMRYYAPIVLDTEVNDLISELVIEGHTSSNGGDEINVPLSLNRAEAVGEYLLSDEAGLTEEQKTALESKLSTVGCASQRLILDENGNEDPDASRRVTFRFVFELETVLDVIETME